MLCKTGKLKITTDFGGSNTQVRTVGIVDVSYGEHNIVSYASILPGMTNTVLSCYDLDLNNKEQLDKAFNQMGTNTYQWLQPMTVLPSNIDDTYPVGSIYTTVLPHFNPNTEFGGTWEIRDSSSEIKWLRTA